MDRVASDEIHLLAHARTLWRHRSVLLAAALISAIGAYAVNRRMPPVYEVSFSFIAFEPPLRADLPAGTSGRADLLARVDGNRRMAQYRAIAESRAHAAAVIEEFGLAAPPHNLTPSRFVDDRLDVRLVQTSGVIVVALRLGDPALLGRIAGRYVERVLAMADRLNRESADYAIGRTLPLQLLDAPQAPAAPVGPRTLRNTTAAALIALVLTAAVVLLIDAARQRHAARP